MTIIPATRLRPAAFARFARREDGGMIVLSLIFFLLMVMMGGMAVDLMRYENARTKLQQTLDRSILAAASLKQTADPEVVVRDYFAKAGMADQLVDVRADPALDSRLVEAEGRVVVPTIFMHMLDIQQITAPASGAAVESVNNIEISLVLDISGSMLDGDQIGKLRTAAKNFFAKVLDGDAAITTSINVVPYAGHVNPGPRLFSLFGATRTHNDNNCIELAAADYLTTGRPATGRGQVPHFMNWTRQNTMGWGWCPVGPSEITVAQNDLGKLNTYIDNMRLHDGTGTMNGIKYGLMLLDPSLNSVFQTLANENTISDDFSDRPLNWSNTVGSDVTKYLIVMTDGNITDQFRPRTTNLVDPDTDALDNEQIQTGTTTQRVNGKNVTVPVMMNDPDTVDGIDYPHWNRTVELNNQPSVNRQSSAFSSRATNLSRFNSQCNLAKANGVIVYTIAFNAPIEAQNEMRACANEGKFANVPNNLNDLNQVFNIIARNIQQLRLTQ